MQVYKIDPLTDPRWVQLIDSHPRASVFHTRAWLGSIYQTYGYKPIVFTTSPPGGELRNGVVFCRIRSWLTGSRMVSLPFSDHCEPLVDSPEELNFLLACLQVDAERHHWSYVEIRPANRSLENKGQKTGFCPANSYYLHRVDLQPSLNRIFQRLDRNSAQRKIERAKRVGVVLECGRSEKLLQEFYRLLVLTRRRHRLPPQPYRWFRNLADQMGEALDVRVAYKDALPIAAILTVQFRKTNYYKYGCSDAKFHNLGPMPALLWSAIQESKAAGSEEFDLGRSEFENEGLITFKNHWTPDHERLTYWRYPASAPLTEGWKLKLVKRAFACMPDGLLTLTGRLIYRHIG